MPPSPQHEALHRIFRQDEALFARVMARVFDILVPVPGPADVTVLSNDLTETEPLERRPDSVLQVEFLVQDETMAVFSALTHSRGPEAGGILETLAAALATTDSEYAVNLAEFTETGLGGTAGLEIWRALMATRTYPFVSQMRLQGREEGREEGRTKTLIAAILKVLDGRKIAIDNDSRARIESCSDPDTLDTWLDRSITVTAANDLFAPC